MGLIRSGALVFVCVLLLVSFIAMNSFEVMSNSLEYENIQGELIPIIREIAESELGLVNAISNNLGDMNVQCQNNSIANFTNIEDSFEIPCSVVVEGSGAILEKIIRDRVDEIYYQEYDCNLLDCNSEGDKPYFLVSEHARDYFNGLYKKFLILSIILFLVVLFLVETRSNAFLIGGVIFILSGIIVRFSTNFLLSLFLSPVFSTLDIDVFDMFAFLFGSLGSVFVNTLIWGIGIILVGVLWKFFSIGFKIQGFFEKYRKPKVVVKEKVVDKK
jgi:hypothetical protein